MPDPLACLVSQLTSLPMFTMSHATASADMGARQLQPLHGRCHRPSLGRQSATLAHHKARRSCIHLDVHLHMATADGSSPRWIVPSQWPAASLLLHPVGCALGVESPCAVVAGGGGPCLLDIVLVRPTTPRLQGHSPLPGTLFPHLPTPYAARAHAHTHILWAKTWKAWLHTQLNKSSAPVLHTVPLLQAATGPPRVWPSVRGTCSRPQHTVQLIVCGAVARAWAWATLENISQHLIAKWHHGNYNMKATADTKAILLHLSCSVCTRSI